MSPPPSLTVIIPSHNTRALTLRCLAALNSGGVDEPEIIVVDDGSDDGTESAVREADPRIQVIRNPKARGFTVSANLGLERGKGQILLLLNSDTEIQANSLSDLLAAFRGDPRLGGAGGQLMYPDGTPQWSGGQRPTLLWLFALASGLPKLLERLPGYRRVRPIERRSSVRAATVPVEWVTGATLAIRRQALLAVGRLDEGFRFYCQDLEYCLRLKQAGWEIAVVPGFRVLHHHGATIRRRGGVSPEGKHLELLWRDLLRWGAKERGDRWANRAASILRWGGRLRLAGHTVARPFVPAADRWAWNAHAAAVRTALAAIASRRDLVRRYQEKV